MKRYRKTLLAILLPALPLCAQSGHWDGTFGPPGMEATVQVDLMKTAGGEFTGTISIPSQKLKGLPLHKISVEGAIIRFAAREDQPFAGELSADGKTISGELSAEGMSIPVSLNRTGDAQAEPAAKNAPIGKELEGTWTAVAEDSGVQLHLILTLSNQADGNAAGKLVNMSEGALEVPLSKIAQNGANVTLGLDAVNGSYSAELKAGGTELAGTFRQGEVTLPLNFKRAAK
jgi:hypothetical protein